MTTIDDPVATVASMPVALLRREEELPFVDAPGLGQLQLLQVDLAQGVWVIRTRFTPGTTIPTHKHTCTGSRSPGPGTTSSIPIP